MNYYYQMVSTERINRGILQLKDPFERNAEKLYMKEVNQWKKEIMADLRAGKVLSWYNNNESKPYTNRGMYDEKPTFNKWLKLALVACKATKVSEGNDICDISGRASDDMMDFGPCEYALYELRNEAKQYIKKLHR